MPKRTSAGLLPYRQHQGSLEVFLVHPGGPFWARRDEGSWSIGKGELAADEAPRAAAVREFEEETGYHLEGEFLPLLPVRQAAGKTVFAFAVAADLDPDAIRSGSFTLEWPPRSGRTRSFPEVDRAAWFPLDVARHKILPAQRPLLDELELVLRGPDAPGSEPSA